MDKRLLPHRDYYLIDSKGHSRFVLRILIILSHRSPQTRRVSASSLEAADETREGRKGPPLRQTARALASSLNASVATVGAFSTVGFLPMFHGPTCQLKPPSISLRNPPATVSGPDPARQGSLIPKDIPGSFCEF